VSGAAGGGLPVIVESPVTDHGLRATDQRSRLTIAASESSKPLDQPAPDIYDYAEASDAIRRCPSLPVSGVGPSGGTT